MNCFKHDNIFFMASAHVLPPEEGGTLLSSWEIEENLAPFYQRTSLSLGRLELLTGVKTRGVWPSGTLSSEIAFWAAKKLFASLEGTIDPKQVDLLIHASVCKDQLEPASASRLHALLGLREDAAFFDLSNACLGVLHAATLAAERVAAGQSELVLIVAGENSGPIISDTTSLLNHWQNPHRSVMKKFIANFTLGSGGYALLVGKRPMGQRLLGWSLMTDSSAHKLCTGSGSGQHAMMETQSVELMRFGLALAEKNWTRWRELYGEVSWEEISQVIIHQVGRAHREALYQLLDMPLDKDYSSFETYGNMGSVALPITLNLANVQKGRILLQGIGSGLSTLMMQLEAMP